jgi:uroporphyrinogen-III synthase
MALPAMLTKRGALVDEISIYRAVAEEPHRSVVASIRKGLDVVTLTSPSIVRHFVTQMIDLGLDPFQLPGAPAMACIGPITSRAATLAGFQPEIVATSYTTDGLVEAICRYIEMKALA